MCQSLAGLHVGHNWPAVIGALLASGSGSAEPKDMPEGPTTLQSVIHAAMEDELREDCNIYGAPPRS